MIKRLPDELKKILDSLEYKYYVNEFHSQYMGWAININIGSKQFNLTCEAKNILISELTNDEYVSVYPEAGKHIGCSHKKVTRFLNGTVT